MCGIAGIVGANNKKTMERMLRSIRHRGPDDEGILQFERLGDLGEAILGHVRLSIIDLSKAGHQPMCNEDGTLWVVFNGEIYNFGDLHKELELHGHTFRSATDTEVILHSFEEWGLSCIDRFNGMFAFALLDTKTRKLVLVRDRLGVKPLYYARTSRGLVFASELKAVLEGPEVARDLDLEALDTYLALGYIPGPRTMFRSIKRLQPGTILEYDGRTVSTRTYWSIPEHQYSDVTGASYIEELRELLIDAVQLRMISDVPVGAFLSGGVDSSAVTAIMADKRKNQQLRTFCVGFDAEPSRHDERVLAQDLARRLGTDHEDVICGETDMVHDLAQMVWYLDEPVAEDVVPPYFALCRKAREHVTVVLTGEGADEFCYGYRFYGLERIRQQWAVMPSSVRRVAGALLNRAPAGWWRKAAEYCLQDDEIDAFLAWSCVFRPEERAQLLGPVNSMRHGRIDMRRWLQDSTVGRSESGVDLIACLDGRQRLVDYILLRTDRLSMAFGLEARTPFLDYRLVEFFSRVPAAEKIQGLTGKMLLRRAIASLLPRETVWRRKKPFATPLAKWLATAARTYLYQSRLAADGVLRHSVITNLLSKRLSTPSGFETQIWTLVMLEVWYRLFVRRERDHLVV